jgi:hypothetical protein
MNKQKGRKGDRGEREMNALFTISPFLLSFQVDKPPQV